MLALLFWLWRPIGGTVWNLSGPGADAIWAVYAAGWAVAVSSTFLISHFDLFGLRQAWLYARRVRYSPPPFTERGLYGRIRHPLMAGFVVIFWSAPAMTAGHVLFAATATGYILVGIAFEEHDLIQSLGETYAAYRARVPALIPRPWLRHPSPGSAAKRGKRQEAGDMKSTTATTSTAGSAQAAGRAAVSARVGMFPPHGLLEQGPETARAFLAQAGKEGIDHVCCGDHVSFFAGLGFDGLVQATALAMLHPTLRVYTGVYLLPLRHPVLVARQLADIARLAPGRLIFGVGYRRRGSPRSRDLRGGPGDPGPADE